MVIATQWFKPSIASDVVMLVTGKKSNHAGRDVLTLPDYLVQKMVHLRINGKGKPTPVADAQNT